MRNTPIYVVPQNHREVAHTDLGGYYSQQLGRSLCRCYGRMAPVSEGPCTGQRHCQCLRDQTPEEKRLWQAQSSAVPWRTGSEGVRTEVQVWWACSGKKNRCGGNVSTRPESCCYVKRVDTKQPHVHLGGETSGGLFS